MVSVNEIKEDNFCHIGRDTKITGEITFSGDTYINATIEGTVHHKSQHNLTLEFHSLVKGTINGHNLTIIGEFEGDINCSGKVIIYPTAKVKGSIKCQNLIVQPGAILEISGKTINDELTISN